MNNIVDTLFSIFFTLCATFSIYTIVLNLIKILHYKLASSIIGRILSGIISICILLFMTGVDIFNTLKYNASDIDIGGGYHFSDCAYREDILYIKENITGFTCKGPRGMLWTDSGMYSPSEISINAVEYTDEYIIARGVDITGEVNFWIIVKSTNEIIGYLSPELFLYECRKKHIVPIKLPSIERNGPFNF